MKLDGERTWETVVGGVAVAAIVGVWGILSGVSLSAEGVATWTWLALREGVPVPLWMILAIGLTALYQAPRAERAIRRLLSSSGAAIATPSVPDLKENAIAQRTPAEPLRPALPPLGIYSGALVSPPSSLSEDELRILRVFAERDVKSFLVPGMPDALGMSTLRFEVARKELEDRGFVTYYRATMDTLPSLSVNQPGMKYILDNSLDKGA